MALEQQGRFVWFGEMIIEKPNETGAAGKSTPDKVDTAKSSSAQKFQTKLSEQDSAALNRRAKELTKKVLQEPDVDNDKIRKIKAAIENGTYEVDADSIAEKLMELEFHGRSEDKQ